jgi:hypothetical protein
MPHLSSQTRDAIRGNSPRFPNLSSHPHSAPAVVRVSRPTFLVGGRRICFSLFRVPRPFWRVGLKAFCSSGLVDRFLVGRPEAFALVQRRFSVCSSAFQPAS